ncbi:PrsW family intramembrane metalloprotease [Bailinhaonella thermotolerans]|uniref:Protease PrsW n=1 Tax=Bailinhaonella thermotolerans TaxID=1070861 RepID=A0A3A4BDD8_9ACTN|nr:PrsW family intramembrane metalloprotease [Bailinhaonella thermotolerans]RJL36116.1 protease PrsW [Bailinhaonella thermotolerans]
MSSHDPRWVLQGDLPGRPSRGLIVGLVAAGVCLLTSFGFVVVRGGVGTFALALVLALAPVPVLLAGVLALDRLEPEPRRDLVFAFAWGAGVAVLFAGLLNSLGVLYLTRVEHLDIAGAQNIGATLGAPLVEETLKGLVLLGLLRFRRQELDGPTDGIIYASMVGLGFAMSENVSYYVKAIVDGGAGELAATVILRGVISPLAHPLFTSMTGIAVAYAAQRRTGRAPIILAGLAAAMFLHGLWNGMASYLGIVGLAFAYLVLALILGALIWVVVAERRRVVHLILAYLPGYRETGLVSEVDLGMLSSMRNRRQARHWARVNGGANAARAMSDYQFAATELVLLHQRLERQIIDGEAFTRRQHALLHLMDLARRAFPRPAKGGAGF